MHEVFEGEEEGGSDAAQVWHWKLTRLLYRDARYEETPPWVWLALCLISAALVALAGGE